MSDNQARKASPAFVATIFAAVNLEQGDDTKLTDSLSLTNWLLEEVVAADDLASVWAVLALLAKYANAPMLNPLLFEKLIAKMLQRCISLARPARNDQQGLTIASEDEGFITHWIQSGARRTNMADARTVRFIPNQLLNAASLYIHQAEFFFDSTAQGLGANCFKTWDPTAQDIYLGNIASHIPKDVREANKAFIYDHSSLFRLVSVKLAHQRSYDRNLRIKDNSGK